MTRLIPASFGQFFAGWISSGTPEAQAAIQAIGQSNPGTVDLVVGEVPIGAIDGSNASFTTAYDFVPESVEVFWSGIRLNLVSEYVTVGTQTINLTQSPQIGEVITVNYQRS